MIEISIAGVRFVGGLIGEPYGLFVKDRGFIGWESGTVGRREQAERPAAHGDFDLPMFRQARVVTISGHAIARSLFDLSRLRDQVTGLGSDGGLVRVHVSDEGDVRSADMRVVSADFVGTGRADWPRGDFDIELVASDPRLFGKFRTVSGSSVQVVNYGNFPASPVVEVVGARSAPYTITGPGGRTVVVSQALTAGQTHRIDFASGGLYRNGARQIGGISVFKPWTIPANGQAAMSISAGSMDVTVADTYM